MTVGVVGSNPALSHTRVGGRAGQKFWRSTRKHAFREWQKQMPRTCALGQAKTFKVAFAPDLFEMAVASRHHKVQGRKGRPWRDVSFAGQPMAGAYLAALLFGTKDLPTGRQGMGGHSEIATITDVGFNYETSQLRIKTKLRPCPQKSKGPAQ